MSHVNIFKIKILQPSFYQPQSQNYVRASTPKKSSKSKNGEANTRDIVMHKLQRGQSGFLKANLLSVNPKKKQSQILQSYKSTASSSRSHRIMKKETHYDNTIQGKQKLQRPQSAMLKKSRKRSWQVYNSKIPIYSIDDVIFKKKQVLSAEKLEDCVVFFKKKSNFARIVKNRADLEWEPICNDYIAKIYGKVQINQKVYFIVENFNNSSIRDIIDSFGPNKQSLVKNQIRSLICGLIHCHSRGIIHNRINPETIFMNKQGNLLIDIVKGSCKVPSQLEKHRYYHYFAPELLNKGMVAQSCDVWAVGCLTLELLTGNVKTSKHHPYNELCKASPSSNKSDLSKLREQCLKFAGKQNQSDQQEFTNQLQENLTKAAFSFIKSCFKLNERVRPELSKLIDHQFFKMMMP